MKTDQVEFRKVKFHLKPIKKRNYAHDDCTCKLYKSFILEETNSNASIDQCTTLINFKRKLSEHWQKPDSDSRVQSDHVYDNPVVAVHSNFPKFKVEASKS